MLQFYLGGTVTVVPEPPGPPPTGSGVVRVCHDVLEQIQTSVEYVYPQNTLDEPEKLLSLVGSFWSSTYSDSATVAQFLASRARLEKQTEQNLLEAEATVGRETVPVYHRELWKPLVFRESELANEAMLPKYGEGFFYGEGAESPIFYGKPVPRAFTAIRVPDHLRKVAAVFNRTDQPTLSWFTDLDYVLRDGFLLVRENPFTRADVATRPIYAGDQIVDREAVLWLFAADLDEEFLWKHFGHIWNSRLESSENYKQLINAVWDAAVTGSTDLAVRNFLAAVADAPVVRHEQEIVDRVVKDYRSLLVITNREVYRYSREAEAIVSPGQCVWKGDLLANPFSLIDLRKAHQLDLPALTLDKNLTDHAPLLFANAPLPVSVELDGGQPRVEFPLAGARSVVEKFWQTVHDRGLAANHTLHQNLVQAVGGTPSEINPLEFLVQNLLRGNTTVVTLRPQLFGPGRLPLAVLREIRRILPPWMMLLFLLNMTSEEDPVIMDGPGDEDRPGCEESVVPYLAGEMTENVTPELVTERLKKPSLVTASCG